MICREVKQILADVLAIDVKRILNNSSIRNDLGADSLDAVEIVMELEDVFDIIIPDDIINASITTQDIVDYIQNVYKNKN